FGFFHSWRDLIPDFGAFSAMTAPARVQITHPARPETSAFPALGRSKGAKRLHFELKTPPTFSMTFSIRAYSTSPMIRPKPVNTRRTRGGQRHPRRQPRPV
ncbi:MAG: hypothetical protein R6U98_19820, partial [Pirellulaceae bacterium]